MPGLRARRCGAVPLMASHRAAVAAPLTGGGDLDSILEDALLPGGIVAHVQCIVDLARGSIVGYEALARFRRAEQDSPGPIFAAARERGRLVRLEAAALQATLARLDNLPDDTFLTVNISPEVISSGEVRDVLSGHGSLSRVVFELTEHHGVGLDPNLLLTVERVRAAGARIAVDDGGSAYTRLHDLMALHPDIIKLDRSMVAGVDRDSTRRMQIELVGTVASRLDAQLLAEGVETLAELDTISRLGVQMAQGYLLARPSASWPIVREQTTALLQTIASQHGGTTLVDLLTHAASVTTSSHAECAPRGEVLVVVDDANRPLGVLTDDSRVVAVRSGLGISYVRTSVTDAVSAALARPPEDRFLPLVCVDDQGGYAGVVSTESLMRHLADR